MRRRHWPATAAGLVVAWIAAWAAFGIEARGRRALLERYEVLAEANVRGAAELEVLRDERAEWERTSTRLTEELARASTAAAQLHAARVAAATLAIESARPARARELLASIEPADRGFEWGALSVRAELLAPALHVHPAPLAAIALSPDGAWLASADVDGYLLLGPSAPGAAAELFGLGDEVISALAFSPSGRFLAAATAAGDVHLIATDSLAELAHFAAHEDFVLALAFAGEELLVSASEDWTLRIWSLSQARALASITPFEGLPIDVAAHVDTGRILAASDEGELALFSLADGARLRTFETDEERWLAVALSGDGRRVAAGGVGRALHVLDAETGAELARLRGPAEPITGVWLDERGAIALASSSDGSIRLYEVDARLELVRFEAGPRGVEGLAAGAGARQVAFFQPGDEHARAWLRPPPRASTPIETSDNTALALVSSADGERWYAGRSDGSVQLIDAASGEVLAERAVLDATVRSLALSPDETLLAVGGTAGALLLLDARNLTGWRALEGHSDPIVDLCFQPDGARLAAAARDGSFRVWSVADGELESEKPGPRQWVLGCALSADGARGLTVAGGGVVRLWELASGARVGGFRDVSLGRVTSLALTPDARRVVLVTGENQIRVYGLVHGELLGEAPRRPDLVAALTVSPDGARFVVGGYDGALRLFSLDDAAELLRLPGGARAVAGLRFSPDGRRLCSALSNGPLELWERHFEDWIDARGAR